MKALAAQGPNFFITLTFPHWQHTEGGGRVRQTAHAARELGQGAGVATWTWLAVYQAAAQWHTGQIHPAVLFFFADESQLIDQNAAAAPKLGPPVAGGNVG